MKTEDFKRKIEFRINIFLQMDKLVKMWSISFRIPKGIRRTSFPLMSCGERSIID